jgi:hypothetical protein
LIAVAAIIRMLGSFMSIKLSHDRNSETAENGFAVAIMHIEVRAAAISPFSPQKLLL